MAKENKEDVERDLEDKEMSVVELSQMEDQTRFCIKRSRVYNRKSR